MCMTILTREAAINIKCVKKEDLHVCKLRNYFLHNHSSILHKKNRNRSQLYTSKTDCICSLGVLFTTSLCCLAPWVRIT